MKRVIYFVALVLSFAALLCFVSCKGNEQTGANTTPVPISESPEPTAETAVPTDSITPLPTAEVSAIPTETAVSSPDPGERLDPVTVEWLAAELMRRYYAERYHTLELEDY